jgi:hypothetical protein
MGCARLRISAFPTIGSGPGAREWKEPPQPVPATASHCWHADTLAALSDQLVPKSSNDQSIPRFTWWDHKGTTEWVQYNFEKPKDVVGVGVYWFDDTGQGGCRVPKSWRLLFPLDDRWEELPAATGYGVEKDKFNDVNFYPLRTLRTKALRLEVQLQPGFSGGILEWRVDTK